MIKRKKILAPKIPELMKVIREHLDNGSYLDTRHATDRQSERNITRPEILYVLKNGFHEKNKDKYEARFKAWNYAVRGKTVDNKELRIIISFEKKNMLVITVIELIKK